MIYKQNKYIIYLNYLIMMTKIIFKLLPKNVLRMVKRKFHKPLLALVKAIPFYGNLDVLALLFNTDKNAKGYWESGGGHAYTQHYSKHFKHLRFKKLKVFEIGVGGYEFLTRGGRIVKDVEKVLPFRTNYIARYI
jgi:hypothetical protein